MLSSVYIMFYCVERISHTFMWLSLLIKVKILQNNHNPANQDPICVCSSGICLLSGAVRERKMQSLFNQLCLANSVFLCLVPFSLIALIQAAIIPLQQEYSTKKTLLRVLEFWHHTTHPDTCIYMQTWYLAAHWSLNTLTLVIIMTLNQSENEGILAWS